MSLCQDTSVFCIFLLSGILFCLCLLPEKTIAQQEFNDYNFENYFEKQLRLFGEAFDHQNYQEAEQHMRILIHQYPKAGKGIYLPAAELYGKLSEQATRDEERVAYIQKSLAMYDSLLHQDESDAAGIMNRQLMKAVQLTFPYRSYYGKVLALFDATTDKLGSQTAYYNLFPYLAYASRQYEDGQVDQAYLNQVYDKIREIIAENVKQGIKPGKYEETGKKAVQLMKKAQKD